MDITGLVESSKNTTLLESLQVVVARWRDALRIVGEEGMVLKFSNAAQIHPALKIAQASEREIRMIVREMEWERLGDEDAFLRELQETIHASKSAKRTRKNA